MDFFISNINWAFGSNFSLLHIVLPLGISFFTFTQIAFLVDSYFSKAKEYSLINYALFISYFPHLLAGPIIHHKEMMPQFESKLNKILNLRNIALGIVLFSIGLFKKVIIADSFGDIANAGFANASELLLIEGWITSLAYTFELYFDFSGYTDMALGISLLFNIHLPINFSSPYKSLNIQQFWRNWHITLSRFLKDYLYIPLGGSKIGKYRTLSNLFIVFLLGGIWHGAGWTFIIWGALHGLASVIFRIYQGFCLKMPKILAWFITFNFINIAWVFFRASSIEEALNVLKAMCGLNGVNLPYALGEKLSFLENFGLEFGKASGILGSGGKDGAVYILVAFVIVLVFKNSNEIIQNFKFNFVNALIFSSAFIAAIFSINKASEFLYFNF